MGPTREISESLVDRIALMTIRLERCGRFDTAHYSERVRDALDQYDNARRDKVEMLAAAIRFDTSACRRLQTMPEGVDWMLDEWEKLRDDLARLEKMLWTINHLERSRELRGVSGSKVRQSRDWVLTEMVRDFFGNESMVDVPPDLDEPGKVAWARAGLLQIVRRRDGPTGNAPGVVRPGGAGRDPVSVGRPGVVRPVEGADPRAEVRGGGRAEPLQGPQGVPRGRGRPDRARRRRR